MGWDILIEGMFTPKVLYGFASGSSGNTGRCTPFGGAPNLKNFYSYSSGGTVIQPLRDPTEILSGAIRLQNNSLIVIGDLPSARIFTANDYGSVITVLYEPSYLSARPSSIDYMV